MIKINNTETMGWNGAILSIRNAVTSQDKGDSKFCYLSCMLADVNLFGDDCNNICGGCAPRGFLQVGKADMKLCKSLIKVGPSDRKFMRMIHVQADVTAPLYWWEETKAYKIDTTPNSCFPMNTILERELTYDDFSHEHLDDTFGKTTLIETIRVINNARAYYNESKSKEDWYAMIQLLPSSFNQMRTIDLNYETLFSIYHQRKNHKLDEWRDFCKWIRSLPYMKEFLGLDKPKEKRNNNCKGTE